MFLLIFCNTNEEDIFIQITKSSLSQHNMHPWKSKFNYTIQVGHKRNHRIKFIITNLIIISPPLYLPSKSIYGIFSLMHGYFRIIGIHYKTCAKHNFQFISVIIIVELIITLACRIKIIKIPSLNVCHTYCNYTIRTPSV